MQAGVKIAMGTDSGVFTHGRNTEELALMRSAGMTSAQALVAATSSAAALLSAEGRIGLVRQGMQANLTVVAGDPFDFTDYRERIVYVMRNGKARP